MNLAAYLLIVVVAHSCSCAAYKILLVAPLPSKSHDILTRALIKYLTNAGHEVTYDHYGSKVRSQNIVSVLHRLDEARTPVCALWQPVLSLRLLKLH